MNLNSLKVIKISNHSFDWIEELQEAMKIALYDRIILLSEKEPFSGIIGFYNSLRLERGTGNIRLVRVYVFIKHDIPSRVYRLHLMSKSNSSYFRVPGFVYFILSMD